MRITTVIEGNTARLTPHGEITYKVLPDLLTALAALPDPVSDVVWDLQHAHFADVAALHLFFDQPLAGSSRLRTIGVTGLTPQPLRLLMVAADVFTALDVAGLDCDNRLGPAA
ncbi:hypothetical protein [Streptomyces sp. NPDC060188]|uniref:hypothetical protein n=1 Tax=Streptomyces sp. NPDC060188 TaxID=3347068 RepID=UPI00364E4E19